MEIGSVADLLGEIKQLQLLEESQLAEIARSLAGTQHEPRALAGQLLQRGWLTPFQANALFQGRGEELILGSYLLLERQGEGVTGQIYKARHRRMRRMVSLVVVCEELLATPGAVDRFYGEIQAAGQLSHPNIVNAYDAGPVGQTHFFAMEYVDGIDLERLVRDDGPLNLDLACEYISQAAQGLQHAWERGLLHHDLRPANLLATRPGVARDAEAESGATLRGHGRTVIKVRNFGLTLLRQTAGAPDEAHAQLRTSEYLAPEQVHEPLVTDVRSNLYSLGACFFYLLTGKLPSAGGAAFSVRHLRPEIPREIDEAIRLLLGRSPDERLQTPADLVELLAPWLSVKNAQPTLDLTLAVQTPTTFSAPLPEPHRDPPSLIIRAAHTLAGSLHSIPGLRLGNGRPKRGSRRWLGLAVIGLSLLFMFGGLYLVVSWFSGGNDGRKALEARAQKALQGIGPFPADSSGQLDYLQKMLTLRQEFPGTSAALQAAEAIGKLPCPLSELDESAIPRTEGVTVADVVGLLGSKDSTGHGGYLLGVNWTHNLIVYREPDNNGISVKNTQTNERLKVFTNEDVPNLWQALLAPDGKSVALMSHDRTVRVYNLASPNTTPIMVIGGRPDAGQPNFQTVWFAYSPDSSLIATITQDQVVRFTEVNLQGAAGAPPTPAKEKMLVRPTTQGPAFGQYFGAFSPDGQFFAVCSPFDRFVRLYDLKTTSEKWAMQLPTAPGGFQPWYFAFSPDQTALAVLCGDRNLRMLDVDTGKQRSTTHLSPMENTPGNFICMNQHLVMQAMGMPPMQYTPDGKSLILLGWELGAPNRGKMLIWNTVDNQERKQIPAPCATNQGMQYVGAVAKDGASFQSMCPDLSQHLWDATSGKELCVLKSAADAITVAAISPTGRSISSGSQDGRVVVWEQDRTGMKPQRTLRGHSMAISALAYAPDGQALVTGSYDRTLRFWDLSRRDGERLKVTTKAMVTALVYAPDGKSVAAAGADGSVNVWDAASGNTRSTLEGLSSWVNALTFSPDGQTLAAAADDGTVRLWSLTNLRERGQFPINSPVAALAFSPENKSLVVGLGGSPFLKLASGTDTTYRASAALLPAVHSKLVRSLTFSPDGKYLASGGDDGLFVLWKVATWEPKKYVLPNPIRGVSFAPDGRHLLTVNANGTAYIFRLPISGGDH